IGTLDVPTGHRDRYTLTRLHAQGGLGQVWLARDEDLGRDIALKELHPEQARNPAVWNRFLEEARITSQLEHPGIVPVYELKTSEDGHSYYTMRFIRGRTLGEAVAEYHERLRAGQAGPLDLLALLSVFLGVCQAVAYAHSRGVIHRDLKGQNIVLGDFGEVIVLDWGLAKLVDRPEGEEVLPPVAIPIEAGRLATLQGQVLGTPAYMAPEQAEGRIDRVDHRSDIYGLGAILYQILTGQAPFIEGNTQELLRKVRQEEPTRPRAICPSVPPPLEAICRKAMAKDPDHRYPLAADLAREVQRFLADEPVEAYPEPWSKRLLRWARRHRTAIAAAAVLLIATTVTLAVINAVIRYQRNVVREQRAFARQAADEMYTQVAEKWLEDRLDPLQESFLQKALAAYERFAREEDADPSVEQERGRALYRIGDIQQRLGRFQEAEAAYQRSINLLGTLAARRPDDPEIRHDLAYAWSRLGVLRTRKGAVRPAEDAFQKALGLQKKLVADAPLQARYRLALARTESGLADLLRQTEQTRAAEVWFRSAIDRLERLQDDAPKEIEPRLVLAAALGTLGLIVREAKQAQAAEAIFRRALKIEEALLAELPTSAGLREGLAKTYNSLGLLLHEEKKPAEAERALKRSLELYQRLADDFPMRPEYRRALARGYINLGLVEQDDQRLPAAERDYRQGIAIHETLAEPPDDFKYRRDLAVGSQNLGTILLKSGPHDEAARAFDRAATLYQALIQKAPDIPDLRRRLAVVVLNRGLLYRNAGLFAQAEKCYLDAFEQFDRLATQYPESPRYQQEKAKCLNNLGGLLAATEPPQKERAETYYRRAIEAYGKLAARYPKVYEHRLNQALCYSNLGDLKLPGAEQDLNRALEIYEALAAAVPSEPRFPFLLAATQINLGEVLEATRRDRAADWYARAIGHLEPLANRRPDAAEYRHTLGYALMGQGRLLLAQGEVGPALKSLGDAAYHLRAALGASPGLAAYRRDLIAVLTVLARAHLQSGDHAAAAGIAEELPGIEPDRPGPQIQAAGILVRCLPLAQADTRLSGASRADLTRTYAARALALLRKAIRAPARGR
ncbi:MAG: protein kinase, partial [Isosphaeraceae bacterium]|nr:protein kinase [Isosphaeraceae bacterium]